MPEHNRTMQEQQYLNKFMMDKIFFDKFIVINKKHLKNIPEHLLFDF